MDDTYMGRSDTLVTWTDSTVDGTGVSGLKWGRVDKWEISGVDQEPPGLVDDQPPGREISGWRREWDEVACTCIVGETLGEEDIGQASHGNQCHQRQPRLWGAGPHKRIPPKQQAMLWMDSDWHTKGYVRALEWHNNQQVPRSVSWTHLPHRDGGRITTTLYPTQPTWDLTNVKFNTDLDSDGKMWTDPIADLRETVNEQAKKINRLERRLKKMKRDT